MFQLSEVTMVSITNTNPRRELHGDENVRAIDLSFSITGENTLLDLIEPGLREHHYCNRALKAGQETLPNVLVPLPNLRFPKLPLSYAYGKKTDKLRGYRFIWDYGTEDAHIDFSDVVLTSLHYDLNEGGSVTVKGTIQYNGEELQDNEVYGELSGLTSDGEIYIKLLAPADVVLANKGYRAGKPDTPTPPTGAAEGQEAGDIFAQEHGQQEGDGNADAEADASTEG